MAKAKKKVKQRQRRKLKKSDQSQRKLRWETHPIENQGWTAGVPCVTCVG